MDQEKLNRILDDHRKWLDPLEIGGTWANLHGANLHGANLCEANLDGANLDGADLHGANLCEANLDGANLYRADLHGANLDGADLHGANLDGANLDGANLCEANLREANLRGANLRGANLRGANLHGADLCGANLCGADLRGANLCGADLRGADLCGADLPAFGIPEEGVLIVWKSVEKGLAKIKVPDGAKRTGSLVGRKCRAEYVETLAIYMPDGKEIDESPGTRDSDIIYRVGTITYPDRYDDDPRVECSHGIHFFLTKAEAEAW